MGEVGWSIRFAERVPSSRYFLSISNEINRGYSSQSTRNYGCVSLGKSKTKIFNPRTGFAFLLSKSIQDHSDHVALKEPKVPLWARTLWFLWYTMIRMIFRSGLICLVKKSEVRFLWTLRIQSCIFPKKRTLGLSFYRETTNLPQISLMRSNSIKRGLTFGLHPVLWRHTKY